MQALYTNSHYRKLEHFIQNATILVSSTTKKNCTFHPLHARVPACIYASTSGAVATSSASSASGATCLVGCTLGQPPALGSSEEKASTCERKTPFPLNFSYVCPEPVLVNRSPPLYIYINGSKRGGFRSHPGRRHLAHRHLFHLPVHQLAVQRLTVAAQVAVAGGVRGATRAGVEARSVVLLHCGIYLFVHAGRVGVLFSGKQPPGAARSVAKPRVACALTRRWGLRENGLFLSLPHVCPEHVFAK